MSKKTILDAPIDIIKNNVGKIVHELSVIFFTTLSIR